MKEIKFSFDAYGSRHTVILQELKYSNSRLAIQANMEDGEPWAILTVNLPEEKLLEGEFFVKTWSENEAVAEGAMKTEEFIDTGKRVRTGFVEAQVWKFKE